MIAMTAIPHAPLTLYLLLAFGVCAFIVWVEGTSGR